MESYTGKDYGPKAGMIYTQVMPRPGFRYVYDQEGKRYSVPDTSEPVSGDSALSPIENKVKEFICPNGRMSVNGVCPIFEGSDGQVKDFKKKSTYDAEFEDETAKDREDAFFKFDFEDPTESSYVTAEHLIDSNIDLYQDYIKNKLGISKKVQSGLTAFSIGAGLLAGGGLGAVAGPFLIPYAVGQRIRKKELSRIQNITDKDPQGEIVTFNQANRGSPDPYGGGFTGVQSGLSSPKTSQGVTSEQHSAFRM